MNKRRENGIKGIKKGRRQTEIKTDEREIGLKGTRKEEVINKRKAMKEKSKTREGGRRIGERKEG